MFHDDSIAGSWTALVTRLNASCTFRRWGEVEPALAGVADAEAITARLRGQVYGECNDPLVGALVRLAAADEPPDDDALLFLLHCLSGVAVGLARELGDLHDDILTLVVGELTCQIRMFVSRGRTRAFAENIRLEARRALLAELRPTVRFHPELGEQVTDDGRLPRVANNRLSDPGDDDDLDLVDLLTWSIRSGVDADGVMLVIATERARAEAAKNRRVTRSADRRVARAHGLCERTLYRRRSRTLTALRHAAAEYLADAA